MSYDEMEYDKHTIASRFSRFMTQLNWWKHDPFEIIQILDVMDWWAHDHFEILQCKCANILYYLIKDSLSNDDYLCKKNIAQANEK